MKVKTHKGEWYTVNSLFGNDCAWMMVFAVLFLLLYNGKKGKNMKWLF